MNKVVLDTNVIVSALLTPAGNPARIYRMFLTGMLTFVFNESILEEYADVFYRPHLGIPADDANIVLDAIRRYGEQIIPVPSTFTMPDEDDRIFYDTAKAAGAYLITGNLKHYPNEPHILKPADFLDL
jgi:putative PIN family toxin of toxin-antitoxin system